MRKKWSQIIRCSEWSMWYLVY